MTSATAAEAPVGPPAAWGDPAPTPDREEGGLRLYEFRPATRDGLVVPEGRIVLVVAADADAAALAVARALAPEAGAGRSVDWYELNDLGAHDGPEENGSVFVNGYGVSW